MSNNFKIHETKEVEFLSVICKLNKRTTDVYYIWNCY
jgi:hypothetical protein